MHWIDLVITNFSTKNLEVAREGSQVDNPESFYTAKYVLLIPAFFPA